MTLHSNSGFVNRPSSQHSVDHKPPAAFFDDFEDVDPTMISPIVADRRDSYAPSNGPLFSPAHSAFWDDEQFPQSTTSSTFPDKQFDQTAQPFVGHSNNPFRMDPSSFSHQHISPWPMFDRSSDSQTPVAPATYEPYGTEYDSATASTFSQVTPMTTQFAGMPVTSNVRPASIFAPTSTPTPVSATSPPVAKEWMSMAEQAIEPRPLPKRLRQNSPPRAFSPFGKRPGDGVRKKLARVDIPLDRNLHNIDSLIANSHNDDEIKELKQQKRLLRNRQAALDSRQRKKKLYEEAQEDKKHCNERVNMLEDELQALRIAFDEQRNEKESLRQQVQHLVCDKENLLVKHSQETGELRNKVQVLTERLNDYSRNVMPSHASTTSEFGEFTSDMDGLTMDSEWDEFSYMTEFSLDPDAAAATVHPQPQKPPSTPMAIQPKRNAAVAEEDRPVASGLLLMLLLCGAFVASKSSGSTQPTIPKMSDEVRAASAVVLDSVFKDAGVAPAQIIPSAVVNVMQPGPSPMAWQGNGQAIMSSSIASMSANLDTLSHTLMRPSREQEAEAAFSLSADQYLSMTSDHTVSEDPTTPQSSSSPAGLNRRHLAESLKAMRDGAKGVSAGDVFTRSLLWDRIPTDVVKEFKRFVEQSNNMAGGGTRGGGALKA